jgi:hypothetical protein
MRVPANFQGERKLKLVVFDSEDLSVRVISGPRKKITVQIPARYGNPVPVDSPEW